MAELRNGVIVVGSLHYDIMVETTGWPQQGETIAAGSWHPKLGGKGRNQAVAARAAGAPTMMAGAIGNDRFGDELQRDLEARGIDTRYLRRVQQGSGISVALSDAAHDYRAFIVSSANLLLDDTMPPPLAAWSSAAALVLQNEVPEAANVAAALRAREAGTRVVLNAAPYRELGPKLSALVDLLVVNAVEAAQLSDRDEPRTLDAALAVAQGLRSGFRAVLVTAGAAGCAYASANATVCIPAEPVMVRSTHGAGDAFTGTLAAALARGDEMAVAMRTATHAAAALISAF